MTHGQPGPHFWRWFLFGLLALASACVQPAPPPYTPPPPPPPTPPGQIEDGRFIHSEYRLHWLNPGDWQPVWPHAWDKFDFAWAKDDSEARLWLMRDKASPLKAGLTLAETQEWEVCQAKIVSWQGYPAWDAQIHKPGLAGRLRTVKWPRGIVAVAALSPHGDQGNEAAKLAGIIDGLYLTPPGDVLHVVQHPNESLSVIAKWYTDSAGDWPKLKEYNGLISNTLVLGQTILIPADLVVRPSPLPIWAVPPLPGKSGQKHGERPATGNDPGADIKLTPIGPK